MANFKNRGERGERADGGRFGNANRRASFGDRPGKPAFSNAFPKKSWGERNDRSPTLHKATCAHCGTVCEVPFRPMSGKPVYCKECFGQKGGAPGRERDGKRFEKREFAPRPPRPSFEHAGSSDAVLTQLEALNRKLERLIGVVETLVSEGRAGAKKERKEVSEPAPEKAPKKKTAKK